jgi:DNA-binding HxlR family transcriptional regulator
MKIEQSLAIMKALADKSRLAIIHSLLERSQYVEELSNRHALAPSTVSFHLRKLEQAGLVSSRKEQYYAVIQANQAMFDTTLREIVAASPVGNKLQDERMEAYQRKVLGSFFRHGRLEKLPAQHKKRLIVLDQFAARFEPERRYSEQEVTGLILPLYDDYCSIRRLLVDEGLIRRDGSHYWRQQPADAQTTEVVLPTSAREGSKTMQSSSQRKELKRASKQQVADIGVYQIRNTANGKLYLGSSTNLAGERNSRLFQLKMGKVVFSRELQEDLTRHGAENFKFSVLAVLDPPKPGEDVARLLAELELSWLEQLQPFGERGYNSFKGYQRELERLQLRRGSKPS